MSIKSHPEFKHDIDTYVTEVARGNVPGAQLFGAFGELVTAGAITDWMVWPGPTTRQPYSSTGVAISVVSTSADDTSGGTGIQQVEIHYIDVNGDEQEVYATMNGITPVVVGVTAKFIQCVHANAIGSGGVAAGDISVTSGGVVYSYLPAGKVRCSSASRYVPNGKTLYITDMAGGSSSGTAAADCRIYIAKTEIADHDYTTAGIYLPYNQVALQDNAVTQTVRTPFPVNQNRIVTMFATVDKGSTLTASWSGWIEDA